MLHPSKTIDPDMPYSSWVFSNSNENSIVESLQWVREHSQSLAQDVRHYGGVLLRGLPSVNSAAAFESVLAACEFELADYVGGTSPRRVVSGKVMTATEVPPDYSIPMHQEMSYSDDAPEKIAFFCMQPASVAGQTTVGDMRKITKEIDARVLECFKNSSGIALHRNLPRPDQVDVRPGVPKPWTEVFATQDENVAQASAISKGWSLNWLDDGSMNLRQTVRSPFKCDPDSGVDLWYNQIHIFAPAAALMWAEHDGRNALAQRIRQALVESPHLVDRFVFADGAEIDASDALHIYEVIKAHERPHNWQAGDVLILDNLRTVHGRRSFQGERSVLTALINPSKESK
jgi:hypothetical protein